MVSVLLLENTFYAWNSATNYTPEEKTKPTLILHQIFFVFQLISRKILLKSAKFLIFSKILDEKLKFLFFPTIILIGTWYFNVLQHCATRCMQTPSDNVIFPRRGLSRFFSCVSCVLLPRSEHDVCVLLCNAHVTEKYKSFVWYWILCTQLVCVGRQVWCLI